MRNWFWHFRILVWLNTSCHRRAYMCWPDVYDCIHCQYVHSRRQILEILDPAFSIILRFIDYLSFSGKALSMDTTNSGLFHFLRHSFWSADATHIFHLQVVGNCMVVSKSGLAAGYPPHMPLYKGWVDCWRHLSSQKQLKRGSSLMFRYYTGPQVIVAGKALPINQSMFRRVQKQE